MPNSKTTYVLVSLLTTFRPEMVLNRGIRHFSLNGDVISRKRKIIQTTMKLRLHVFTVKFSNSACRVKVTS